MNEKEAREIIEVEENEDVIGPNSPNYYEAKGYLEAIEKAKGLERMLKKIQLQYQSYSGDTDQDIEKALAKWEKEK